MTSTFRSGSAWIGDRQVYEMKLTIDQEIDHDLGLSTSRVPDLDWTYTDRAGHWHAFADDGSHPTFNEHEYVVPTETEEEFDLDTEYAFAITETRYACKICDQEIKPNFKIKYHNESVPGMKSWTVEAIMTKLPVPTPGVQTVIRIVEGDRVAFGIATVSAVRHRPGEARVIMVGVGPLAYRQGHDT